jgi:PAS domain S-box-containing protein
VAALRAVGDTDRVSDPRAAAMNPDEHDPMTAIREALVASGTGTWRWDIASGVVDWDPTMESLCGLEPGAFGRTYDAWLATLHPEERDWILTRVEGALDRRSTYSFEHRVVWPDGSVRWLECRGQVTTDARGEPTGTVGSAIDVTSRKEVETEREALLSRSNQLMSRLDRLQQISGRLAGAVTVAEVGQIVVDLLHTPNTAGNRGLWVVDEASGTLELVASTGIAAGAVEQFRTIPLDADLPAADAVRERRTIRSSSQEAAARYHTLATVEFWSEGFMVVPLMVEDACQGVVAIGYGEDDLSDLDLQFLEAAAGYIGQTMARARLSEAVAGWAQDSVATAERERRRREQVEFIAQVTGAAAAATDHADLMERVTSAAVPRLGDWCVLYFMPDGESEPAVVVAHVDPGKVEWARQLQERYSYDPDAPIGAPAAIRTGTTQFHASIDDALLDGAMQTRDDSEPDAIRAVVESLDLTSIVAVPLITRQGVIGAMQFVTAESKRRYEPDDVALAEAAAGRIADALYASWITEQQRRIAASLQRALLPPDLPTIAGIEVAARYWPAGVTSDVGGDFYDLFTIGDERWAVVIGDVCGSGPDAAAVTSIARHTTRAAARHGHDHPEVLGWVNEAVIYSDRDLFCTVCYATIGRDDGRWSLRVSAAGHPLPIVRRAAGGTLTVGSPGTLLGVFHHVMNATHEVQLEPGDVVLFYTDGITDLPPPHGIDAEEVAVVLDEVGGAGTSAGAIADAIHSSLEARVPDASRHDDVAVLVLRIL